jgi:uronate dehydrogenase
MSPAPTAPRTILLTGAAGGVGTFLRASLPAEYGHTLRLFDRAPIEGEPEAIIAELADTAALQKAVDGVDAIVHLAGIPVEAPFADILTANIQGTYNLYEAARAAGVRRVVFASSNHAVGFTERPEGAPASGATVPVGTELRPDTYYGLSKCFGENLASLYADKHGIETVSVRIGSCFAKPRTVRMLDTWLSPADCHRLTHAAVTAELPAHSHGHHVVYGISANTRAWWSLDSAREIGFDPQDDSEPFAEELIAELGALTPDNPEYRLLGGAFTTHQA